VNVTPGLARNSRFSPSSDSKTVGIGVLALSDCFGEIRRAAKDPQNTIAAMPIVMGVRLTDHLAIRLYPGLRFKPALGVARLGHRSQN